MPNHAHNILELFGPVTEINHFIIQIKGDKENLDFNKLVTMPPELSLYQSPVLICSDGSKQGSMTTEKSDELIAKYGSNNWYDWARDNWGTKWGAYDCGEWNHESGVSTIFYQTAWSPATEFYINVSKLFPKLTFKHLFSDEEGGASFVGYQLIRLGKIEEFGDFGWDSEPGQSLREELGTLTEESEIED